MKTWILFACIGAFTTSNLPFKKGDGTRLSQKQPLEIITDVPRPNYHSGDTVTFTVKNNSARNRGYQVVATPFDKELNPLKGGEQFYTAFFNSDTAYFRRLSKSSRSGKFIPSWQAEVLRSYELPAYGFSTFRFVLKGKTTKEPTIIKLQVVPDIIEGEPQHWIYTKQFNLFVQPIY